MDEDRSRTSHDAHHSAALPDEEMLQRILDAYPKRFTTVFWEFFARHVVPDLSPRPVVVDLACGAGLLLRDMGRGLPEASLRGYDVSPTMLDHARGLDYGGHRPTLHQLDLATEPIPLESGSVHLVTLTLALHHFDDLLALLHEARRLLAPRGLFLLCEWERTSFEDYLARWNRQPETMSGSDWTRTFQHHGLINRFTAEDWRYLLQLAGFETRATVELERPLLAFLAVPASTPQAGEQEGPCRQKT